MVEQRDVTNAETSDCCPPEQQSDCCTPSEKAECCSPDSSSCGCSEVPRHP
jgi:hypothetical protein